MVEGKGDRDRLEHKSKPLLFTEDVMKYVKNSKASMKSYWT